MEFLHSWTGLKDEYEVVEDGDRTNCPEVREVRDATSACVMDDTYGEPTELCRPETHNLNTEQENVRGMDCYSWLREVMSDAGHTGFQVPPIHILGPRTAPKLRFVYLTIQRVRQITDPDPGPFQGPGDYYASVRMGGVGFAESRREDNSVDSSPDWLFGLAFASDRHQRVPIHIEIWDDDPLSDDDLCDISPVSGKRGLDIEYDTATGGFTGDVSGTRDTPRSVFGEGGGEENRVEMTFVITSR
jgi:hypothetical protein